MTIAFSIHTILLFYRSSHLFIIPDSVVFQHASPPTNFVLKKPFKYQNVQFFTDITACIFCFSTSYTFGNIQLFLQNFAHSSSWGIFQISFCYNFNIRSAIHTYIAICTFQLFQIFFFKKKIYIEIIGKSSNPLQNSSPFNLFFSLIL